MSDQFYDYLSDKLLNYFEENKIPIGERFFISFDEDEEVLSFYNSLKRVAETKYDCPEFSYTHENSTKEYVTYAININGVKLVVSESLNATDNYLNTLRNELKPQEKQWKNTALLIICTESIESIFKAMGDLQKEGMPLNVKSISNNLKEEIKYSKDLNPSEKEIAKFSLDILEDDVFETSLWDYETILSIINKGYISDEDLKELNLFKDEQLTQYPQDKWADRLNDNYETFCEVNNFSQYGEKKEQLKKMFTKPGVDLLSKDDWYTASWKEVEKYKDDFDKEKKPLEYIENNNKISENGLIYWERPNNASTKPGQRKRNIIVFNNNSSSKVSLEFKFKQRLRSKDLKSSKKVTTVRGKSLFVNFDVNQNEPTFETVRYVHKDQNSSAFTFSIAVLNFTPEIIDTIKSRYTVNSRKKKIELINDEDSYDIEFGVKSSSEKTNISISEDGEIVYLHDDEFLNLSISEESDIWGEKEVNFTLQHHNDFIPFVIKDNSDPPVPKNSYFIWNLKRKNRENFIFNGVTAVQDVNSFSLYDKFKEYLKMEEEIIDKRIFYAKRNIDKSLEKIEVSFSENLENAYLDILNYYKNYDDSPIDNLPSLFYLNDDLKELYEKFIDIFNEEISEIGEGCILSEFKDKRDLLKIGRIDTDNEIMYSPLSPINIAYQLEIANQCGNEDLPVNIINRLVPNNLIPYIYSDDGIDLFRPIHQEDAHEWLIYKRSEEVSIGTTNAFISNVVTEKLKQFVKHFDYLFSFNNSSPIKINLINIKDDKEVVKGVFNFIKSRLNDKNDENIPVEINIYEGGEKSYFDNLFDCQSENQLDEEFGIKRLKSNTYDPIDIIHMVQDNISYYKHPFKKEEYEYAHISFYKVKSHNNKTVDDDMDNVETGLSLNGLLSSVSSTAKSSSYRLGFGTANIPKEKNRLIDTAINLNELAENSKYGGMGTYSKNRSISTIVELDGDNIEELYEKSHWVTFIEPTFGIEYFDSSEEDLIIINSSDQYSSSSKYDTITVTGDSTLYKEIIKDLLKSKNVLNMGDELSNVIKIFNAINGEWLLRIISNSGEYDREKLSIISAIKYCLAILDHDDIVWIPISMEEIIRIAGNVKLDKNKGIFDPNLIKGAHSDDLLFIGVKFNQDNRIEIIFYPIEVKIGRNESTTIKKGKYQLDNTYKLLRTQLQKINAEGSEFKSKFFRNFFIQILLSNEQKLVANHIWDEKCLDRIEEFKTELLNDEYDIIYGLEEYIGIGSLFSFKTDSHHSHIYMDGNKQVIELPEEFAYNGLATPIEKIHQEIQEDKTDILAKTLLSNINISDIRVDNNVFYEFNDEEESEDDEDFDEDFDEELIEEESDNSDEQNEESKYSNPNIENGLNENDEESSSDISNIRALIGTQKGYNHKVYWEFGHPSLANRHMLIQGKSGQGKTYFIQRMLKELSNQGVPCIIIDYTDGFKPSQLELNFKESLGDKIKHYFVVKENFPLNPFKRNTIMIDEDISIEEDNSTIASRFKSIINSVYGLGIQQSNTLYQTVLECLDKYGDNLDLNILKEELINDESNTAKAVLNKLNELLDKNPFASTDFDWSILDNNDGNVYIIQLTALSKDIQTIITEFILWDLWNYKSANGSEKNPFVMVLDEAHNLDFSKDSPCSKILTEGRKFGWSGWFATQSVKGSMKIDEIAKLENADEKIYFHPTDISSIAKDLSKDAEGKKRYEKELSQLTKGYCIVQGSAIDSDGKLYQPNPLTVKIDEITIDKN